MTDFDAKKTGEEIVRWIRDYFNENGADSPAVVGLSGGKDSSVVAALCVRALGADRVFGVLMPRGEQWDIDFSLELAALLGIRHCVVNVADGVDSVLESIRKAGLKPDRPAEINTPARIRMTTLYAISAILGGRVANTCNLSEDWVGYSTKYGDSAGDFSPLSRLTVTEVKAVGRELGLPAGFVEKTPEDGLSGLSDEENLGFSYDVLDRYIRTGVCENPEIRNAIDRLHRLNLHKHHPVPHYAPPSTKGGESV